MTSGHTERSDWFVTLIVSRGSDGISYLREIVRGKYDVEEQVRLFTDQFNRFKPSSLAIDATANQVILSQILKKTTLLPIVEIQSRANKDMRIQALVPLFKQGAIRVNKVASWFKQFELEYGEYVPDAEVADQLDTLAMAMQVMGQRSGPLAFLFPTPKYAYSSKLDELLHEKGWKH